MQTCKLSVVINNQILATQNRPNTTKKSVQIKCMPHCGRSVDSLIKVPLLINIAQF